MGKAPTKKLLVYLDQNFLAEKSKAGMVNEEMAGNLMELLHQGFRG